MVEAERPPRHSSVMLLDCARLRHWRWDEDIDALFRRQIDYASWISLQTEPPNLFDALEEEWNRLDTLDEAPRLLHLTERSTRG